MGPDPSTSPGPAHPADFFAGCGPDVAGAGSLTSLHPARRIPAAATLADAGLWVHVDIMEPAFAGRHGMPTELIGEMHARGIGPIDVHLMVHRPQSAMPAILAQRPDRVTVHLERLRDPSETAAQIRAYGASPWLALNPATSADTASAWIDAFDGVLVMLVPPGTTGAPDPAMADKLRTLGGGRRLGVDGGVTRDNLPAWVAAGARYIVVGRALVG